MLHCIEIMLQKSDEDSLEETTDEEEDCPVSICSSLAMALAFINQPVMHKVFAWMQGIYIYIY